MEVTKALAALQPLYGKDNVEIGTVDGQRVRGIVRSMKTTQALTTPSVKIECANGEVIKIPFPTIAEIKDHNTSEQSAGSKKTPAVTTVTLRSVPAAALRQGLLFCQGSIAYSTPF